MEKFIEILNNVRAGYICMGLGTLMILLGLTGSAFEFQVMDGQQDKAFFGGLAVLMVGVVLAFIRARKEGSNQ